MTSIPSWGLPIRVTNHIAYEGLQPLRDEKQELKGKRSMFVENNKNVVVGKLTIIDRKIKTLNYDCRNLDI